METQLVKDEAIIEGVMAQDEPPLEAIEREERAEKGKPEYLDLTASELNRIAVKEHKEQATLRGPVIVPEWDRAGIFCKRLPYSGQVELVKVYTEHGIIGAFCYRALNSKGERIFPSIQLFLDSMQDRWNAAVIERVVGDMTTLCRTQLTDKELGKS